MLARLARSTSGLVVLVALLFALATLAIGMAAHEVTHEALEEQLDHRISAETASLLAEAGAGGETGLAEAIRRRGVAPAGGQLDYLLVGGDGRIVASTMTAEVPARPGYTEHLRYRRGDRQGTAQAMTTRVAGGMLVVAADRGNLEQIDRTLAALFAGALAAMLLLGIAAATLVGLVTRSRLARIDATALAIIKGDLEQRVPLDGSGSEFDRLAITLNRMLDRIAGLMADLRLVSSEVAHDLRTPLTRLLNRLDRALLDADPSGRTAEIEAARRQAEELLDIFAALLRIAEIEGRSESLPRQSVDVSALAEQMAETYAPDLEASDRRLVCTVEPGLHLHADRRLLAQALSNLLENALRHTPVQTTVTIAGRRRQEEIELLVRDDGPGIAPADRPRMFQRFARGERARSTPGHGLGLALVAAIASAHGGSASLAPGSGFGVLMRFPGPRLPPRGLGA